ncbi:MAG: hypothetical protein KDB14_18230 [Planctomycetales bacterium]|nr:hypothetical protein [Planctomycetales bacterium]
MWAQFRVGVICLAFGSMGLGVFPFGPVARLVQAADDEVSVRESVDAFTLSNGTITASVSKRSGDLRSLRFKGVELLTDRSGHAGGYWSHDTSGGVDRLTRVTIDPAANGGERAEVAVKGVSGGRKMGHGPGAASDGDFPADIEIRYCLGRGDSGIYTYCIFDHLPEYGAATMTEARYAAKLAADFDWISVDAQRNKHYPRALPGEDKYVYTAIQSENLAFGFASTKRKVGFYFVNSTIEYLSGGPTKPEFLCHRDTTSVQAPVVLNYWRSSHYGGANVSVEQGERWTRVIGPFLLYVNEGAEPLELWRDARRQAVEEAKKWPYDWVQTPGYANRDARSVVKGRLKLDDPLAKQFAGRLMVGLAHGAYQVPGWRGRRQSVSWQTDAKHLQFWAPSDDPHGAFSIPHVAPGEYTLYAFADGILGEFEHAGVKVAGGGVHDVGELTWKPVRQGRPLWEIGIPNRSASEFAGADRFFEPDIVLQYAKLFPDDVQFTVGKSDPSRDWFYAHVPHNEDSDARVVPFRGVSGRGRATPYRIGFVLEDDAALRAENATAVLRLAVCGTGTRFVAVSVNGKRAGEIALGRPEGVITRHQLQGLWYERQLEFPASLLASGDNEVTLTVPAGANGAGVVYDYLRLELASPKGK